MSAKKYDVLDPYAFLEDVEFEASRAKTRVWTQVMSWHAGTVTSRVSALLQGASSKKLDTRLHVDWFSKSTSTEDEKNTQTFTHLQEKKVHVLITNPPTRIERIFPYKGRNHMKMTIIDDIVYLGGVNYGDNDFSFHDFMVKITDPKIVDAVVDIFMRVEQKDLQDEVIHISPEAKLIIDCGKTGRSPILDFAIAIVSQAKKSVRHTTQLSPDGRFLKALYHAYKRGINVEVIIPYQNTFNPVLSFLNKLNQATMKVKRQKIPLVFLDSMVHAKLTIVDGTSVLFGSHNLSQKGVRMKTGEVALSSTNKILVRNLQRYYDSLKKKCLKKKK